jgi:hypothetical protein
VSEFEPLVADLLGAGRRGADATSVVARIAAALVPELALQTFVPCERCAAPIALADVSAGCSNCSRPA